ncbi:hypothetical protein AB6A40_001405 [Gnathostoma spinigerum]|uniref:Uncharacterized protein n=1 Tax=Gnathostoma spinigerum TaxID=75299 RepID=A0ABD6EBA5_9BILA
MLCMEYSWNFVRCVFRIPKQKNNLGNSFPFINKLKGQDFMPLQVQVDHCLPYYIDRTSERSRNRCAPSGQKTGR